MQDFGYAKGNCWKSNGQSCYRETSSQIQVLLVFVIVASM